MSGTTPQGLKGLKGLGALSKTQYDAFVNNNIDLISKHRYDPVFIQNLYSNKQFIDRYGIDKFKAIPDINVRNTIFKDDIINTEFDKRYKQTRTNKGLGNLYDKYNAMSPDAKLKLMESNYLTPSQLEDKLKKDNEKTDHGLSLASFRFQSHRDILDPKSISEGMNTKEINNQISRSENQKILDRIYNDDVDNVASRYSDQVSKAYMSGYWTNMSDTQIKQAFVQAITPGSYKGNMGIPEFASHYGNGSDAQIQEEMRNFSIDDMRQILAKKQVYDANLSPDMAFTALNNEAQRYIKDHQGTRRKLELFAKDVGISTMSYTADKLNGIGELYRMGQDEWAEKPIVWVDDKSNIIDPKKIKLLRNNKGQVYYKDGEGTTHSVHQEQVDYTTLHNLGKNTDGSDIEGAFGVDFLTLNPQYWTRAEQFGTLDENKQKQYEKLGSSPYKIAYDPNDDGDIWYEAFKMMSFGLADMASQIIPYGVGYAGKALSTAKDVGKVARGFGKVMNTAGKALTAETKVGQVVQGTAGALGIAYAYNRGTFQETLAKNIADAEQVALDKAKEDIYNAYQNNKDYRSQIDKLINTEAAKLKANYIAQVRMDGGMQIADEQAVNKMLHARAQQTVLGQLVQDRLQERKASKDYANLQQEAINSAGDVAFNTYWTEGIKYGLVNTMGYRKYLYTNPAGLQKKVSSSLKGLKEITTSAGRKRLSTEASKFLTRGDKLKEFGKTVGSQFWGGAWTNGTDDMQVDAAERINEDSFNRYLNAYRNGEAMADVYGFADGLYSYMKGLSNSLGQETTWNAGLVGGLGSMVNVTPNFVNIARLATKEGRQAYKDNFRRSIERDKDGIPLKNEDGSVKYKDNGKFHDWRGQLNYFIQNGVLNTYYGKKQAEKDLQNHADYVNNLLDSYNDFVDIEHLMASNIASENVESVEDKKTMDFIKALHAVNTLENLGRDSNDPTTMSSVVQNAKTLIDKASQLNLEGEKNPFSEDEVKSLLSQYYASNPGVEQSDYNNQKALYNIAQNAQMLKDASEAFDKAEKTIQSLEKKTGKSIDPIVRTVLKEQQALDKHWRDRKETMQSEIDDPSNESSSKSTDVVASVGGKKNAEKLIKVYEKQNAELQKQVEEQSKKTVDLSTKVKNVEKDLKVARLQEDSKTVLDKEKELKELSAEYESSNNQETYLKELISMAEDKKHQYERGIEEMEKSSKDEKTSNDNVLTADDIFGLDPITRARMMREENRSLYNEKQQREIEKLEKRLLMRDPDALQKIQDIALLTQRIESNSDAYSRMIKSPEAAASALESQRRQAAQAAYELINYRNAESAVEFINQFKEGLKNHDDISDDLKDTFIYRSLRKLSPDILDIINNESLLPEHQKQVTDAIEWGNTVRDLDAVITNSDKDDTWKENIRNNINDIVENANNKKELLSNLEKVVDDTAGTGASEDFGYILKELEKLGYQRDATIIENRKQKKEREEATRKKKEEEKKKLEEETKKAAEKKPEESTNVPTEENMGDTESVDLGNLWDTESTKENEPTSKIEKEEPAKKEKEVDAGKKNIANDVKRGLDLMLNTIQDTSEEGLAILSKYMPKNIVNWLLSTREKSLGSIWKERLEGMIKDASDRGIKDVDKFKTAYEFMASYFGAKDAPRIMDYINSSNTSNGKEGDTKNVEDNAKTQEKSTAHIDFDIIRKVPSNEYEDTPETAKHEENATFEAHSTDKKDGVWYFNGNFAGSKEQTTVKSTRDLDNKESQDGQSTTSEGVIIQGNDTAYANIEREGEDEIIESPTLDQQLEDTRGSGKEAYVSSQNEDSLDANTKGELFNSNDVTTLSGNAMSRYVPGELEKNTLVNKKGEEGRGTSMDDFYVWMDAAGIKLQNIIDRELGRILSKNPHAKVKFMRVAPSKNATHDDHMKTHLMLVLDYDDKVNKGITAIHDSTNGGVIESNGKKYLLIGTAGYGNMNLSKRTLYDILFNPNLKDGLNIKSRARKFFETNPNERFYVTEDLSTEIVPYSIIPGYIIKKQVGEENTEFRNISDILADEKRNPLGYTMEDLGWGIQELQKFLLIGASPDQVMVPRNRLRNLGSAFVLVPASNSKFVPGYIKPCSYNEMREGSLKQKADDLLRKAVTQNDPKARRNAIIELGSIFYLDKNGNYILSRNSRNEVSLVHDGEVYKRFVLDDNFNPDAFIKAFGEIKPMVNITARVLNSPKLLKEYEEAGALTTDLALFSTAGSSYSIYALDKEGNMIVPKSPVNEAQKEADSSDFRRKESQVIYNHQYYMENDGVFTLHGNTIIDEKTLEQLKYNKRIVDGKFTPVETKGENDIFILSTGDNPEVVSVNRNTKYVKVMPKDEAQKLIDRINEQRLKKEREEAAQETMKNEAGKTNPENPQNGKNEAEVEILADTEVYNYEVDPDTGELIVVDTPSKPSSKGSAEPILLQTEQGNHIFFQEDVDLAKQIVLDNPSNPIAELQSKMELDYRTAKELAGKLGWKELVEDIDTSKKEPAKESTSDIHASNINKGENKATTQNFVTLFKNKDRRKSIQDVISEKWKDAPIKPGELNEYLRKKGIEVDNIGTSKKDISNWLRTLEDCK